MSHSLRVAFSSSEAILYPQLKGGGGVTMGIHTYFVHVIDDKMSIVF